MEKLLWIAKCAYCGEEFRTELKDGWHVHVVGCIQFRCPCGRVMSSCDLWGHNTDDFDIVEEDKA